MKLKQDQIKLDLERKDRLRVASERERDHIERDSIASESNHVLLLEEKLNVMQRKWSESQKQIALYESRLALRKVPESPIPCSPTPTSDLNPSTPLRQYHELTRQNTKLLAEVSFHKRMRENTDILKEENLGLSHQLELMSTVTASNASLKLEIECFKQREEDWKTFIRQHGSDFDVDSPMALAQRISSLNKEIYHLKDQMGDLTAHKSSWKLLEADYESRLITLTNDLTAAKEKIQMDNKHLRRVQGQKDILDREVRLLKESIASYDTEERTTKGVDYDTQKMQRISGLEESITAYKDKLDTLIKEMKDSKKSGLDVSSRALQPKVLPVYTPPTRAFNMKDGKVTEVLTSALEILQTEFTKTAEDVKDHELTNIRLKSVFREKAGEYRDSVKDLFGT